MAYSMTGWGTCKTPKFSINIRGVNSKYREVFLHLPSEMFGAEPYMHKYFSEAVTRGRVDVYMNINTTVLRKKFSINEKLFREAYAATARMLKKAGGGEKPPVGFILGVDGVAAARDAESLKLFSWEKIKPYAAAAVKDFLRMKKAEGLRLVKDIEKHLDIVEAQAAEVKKMYDAFKGEFTAKAKAKIETIMGKEGKSNFLNAEVVEVLDRYEVTEELVRIESHLKHFRAIIAGKNAPGRKIDFLAQELNREANTIGSKIPYAQIAHAVIVIKESTEKIREQAQNLE
jgi:uncharacterized protein (TIGR00255 family)